MDFFCSFWSCKVPPWVEKVDRQKTENIGHLEWNTVSILCLCVLHDRISQSPLLNIGLSVTTEVSDVWRVTDNVTITLQTNIKTISTTFRWSIIQTFMTHRGCLLGFFAFLAFTEITCFLDDKSWSLWWSSDFAEVQICVFEWNVSTSIAWISLTMNGYTFWPLISCHYKVQIPVRPSLWLWSASVVLRTQKIVPVIGISLNKYVRACTDRSLSSCYCLCFKRFHFNL